MPNHERQTSPVHHATLISTIATGFALAFALGYIADRLRLPPLVGYLLAGVLVGPFTPGFVADGELSVQLAEVGIILLMFGVGLHFSAADLLAVRRLAVPGAILQIVLATALGIGLCRLWGWPLGTGLVVGLSLSVASTVVLLKALEERNLLESPNGRVAVGWLIVEDLAMVLALVLLPAFAEMLGGHATGPHDINHASDRPVLLELAITLAKVGAFAATALILGPRIVPWILARVARTGSRELFTLSVLAIGTGLTIAAGLAQVGEFSFILLALGINAGLVPTDARDLVVGGALFSIVLNPLVFYVMGEIQRRLQAAVPAGRPFHGQRRYEALRQALGASKARSEQRHAAETLKRHDFLQRFPVLQLVGGHDLDSLLLMFRPQTASPGKKVIHEGTRGTGMYFITSGAVEVALPGRRVRLEAGDFFGEMALLSGDRRTADVIAVDFCQLLVLDRRDFNQFMAHHPALRTAVAAIAEKRRTMNQAAPLGPAPADDVPVVEQIEKTDGP